MRDVLLGTAARLILPLMLLFSVFLFSHGHDAPGGGFVGGLTASGGLALTAVAFGAGAARRLLRADARTLAAAGFGLALAAGSLGLLEGEPWMTGQWILAWGLELGTPMLFEAGIYLLVIGSTSTLALTLLEGD